MRFAYRLAAKLGHVNVNRMLDQIHVGQFAEWQAYAQLEPFDEERMDVRFAHIVQTLINLKRGKKGPKPLKDFVLKFGEREVAKPKSWQSLKAMGKFLTAAFRDKKAVK